MPRPSDTYAHSQFAPVEPVDPNPNKSSVRCKHCKTWTGAGRSLERKKAHLLRCPQYGEWRAAGNGEELQPTQSYAKRTSAIWHVSGSPGSLGAAESHQTRATGSVQNQDGSISQTDRDSPARPHADASSPAIVLTKRPDLKRNYENCFDDVKKTITTRCLHCGFVRARNTTRQVQHLLECREFLNSANGQSAIANGEIDMPPKKQPQGGILHGNVANPHLSGVRWAQGPARAIRAQGAPVTPHRAMPPPAPPRPAPSLANHLLSRDPDSVNAATQQPFLSHAGCGTISSAALTQWLAQDAHISREFVSFVGRLIGKMRLPDTAITMENTTFRTFDLLISTLNNVRREMSFFDTTASKYGLQIEPELPRPATKGYVDLLASASGSGASLLEGLVLLWTTEHCYRASWHYASTFTNTNTTTSNYSLPAYMTGSPVTGANPFAPDGSSSNENHINALHQALIPNWTSPAFSKFVDACRSIVDEVANSMTTGNGREEMVRCEQTFKQALWLWKGIWPEINGMGESDELPNVGPTATPQHQSTEARPDSVRRDSSKNAPIEIQDDESAAEHSVGPESHDGDAAQMPYGGTGLGAVHHANQSS